ncbi:MAG: helix-turn-helix domain-containing protein [Desulfobacteraceae bacterium]|nr:helix-turn-helix domain-containing protein [Desulfobacteraceae bacterium]
MVTENRLGPMLTVGEVAQLLHIHNNTVRRWSDLGMFRAYRISRRGDRRFKREDIVRFLTKYNAR